MRACLAIALAFVAATAAAQQVTKETIPGVTNFARLETTVACGGATTAAAVPELKKMGFASIINLRVPTEKGANRSEEHTSELQSLRHLVCRLLLEKKKEETCKSN